MPKIVAAALLGGPLTTALLWGHGPIVAVLLAPIGGSCAGLLAGLAIAAFDLGKARRDARAAAVPHSISVAA